MTRGGEGGSGGGGEEGCFHGAYALRNLRVGGSKRRRRKRKRKEKKKGKIFTPSCVQMLNAVSGVKVHPASVDF